VPFGRRRRGVSHLDRQEQEVVALARDAIHRVRACFTTDPDEYEVKAAIVFEPTANSVTAELGSTCSSSSGRSNTDWTTSNPAIRDT
jgi:hypothetical protein